MNAANPRNEISKSVSSPNSRRVSVIKWIGKELDNTLLISASKWESSSTKQKFLSPSASKAKKFSSREGKYPCSFCERSFKWRSHWESHERTHTGERPFQCAICGKSFTRSDGLQCHKTNHIKQNMKDSQWFKPHSPASWRKYNDELPKGKTIKFDNETTRLFTCSVCDRVFLSSVGLVKHFRAHKGRTRHFLEFLEIHPCTHLNIDLDCDSFNILLE